MSENEHIVVVDDDEDVRETVAEYLGDQGFRVTAVDGGEALRGLIESGEEFDVAILDIRMPGEDGLSLARFLRESSDVGIMMLTASGETVDRIVGYEMGADDYVPKPFELRELLARIKALLRRKSAPARSVTSEEGENKIINFGKCRLDLDAHKLYDEDGMEMVLKTMEFDLLKTFAERPNRVLSREQILDLAHNRNRFSIWHTTRTEIPSIVRSIFESPESAAKSNEIRVNRK
jgi:two-component system phosphate regulon response regulator OmpR